MCRISIHLRLKVDGFHSKLYCLCSSPSPQIIHSSLQAELQMMGGLKALAKKKQSKSEKDNLDLPCVEMEGCQLRIVGLMEMDV